MCPPSGDLRHRLCGCAPRREPKGVVENVRSGSDARPRWSTGRRGGPDPDGAEHRPPGPGRLGPVPRPPRGVRFSQALHPGPEPGWPPAHVLGGWPTGHRLQWRDLQLHRVARRAAGRRVPFPIDQRHRGLAGGLPTVGPELPRQAERDVGICHPRPAPRRAVRRAGPVRRKAPLRAPGQGLLAARLGGEGHPGFRPLCARNELAGVRRLPPRRQTG